MDNTNVKEESGLSLKAILLIIRKHIIAIVAFLVVGFGAGYIKSKVDAPVYSASCSMMVSYEGSENTAISTQYTFSNYIQDTYVVFVKEGVVMKEAAKEVLASNLYTEYTETQLASYIKSHTSVSADNLILRISYTDSDPDAAVKIVNLIANAAETVADKEADGKPVYHMLKDNLRTLTPAEKAGRQSSTTKNVLIFTAIGAVLAFGYVFIRELLDTRFKSKEDVEAVLGIPVLSEVLDYDVNKKEGK